ncbi:PilZ domain-containing protein [Sulfuriflexus mobilis]|uniref:PilZ domain-containing protein n=1 Tax=Sulfuriflexus mobilis TaxID=1811807 RepID=UPI001559F9C4|nr:PilZ domain-containing protein [Sulfuriflexus mobilis]
MQGIYYGVFAFLLTVALVYGAMPLAVRYGFVDSPGAHKYHRKETPLVGGIAMFLGLAFTSLFMQFLNPSLIDVAAMLYATALIAIIGSLDDLYGLRVAPRLGAQILAGMIMAFWGGATLLDLGHVFGAQIVSLGMWAIPLTIFCYVGAMNAMNMVDGIDGSAGGIALISLSMLSIVAAQAGLHMDLALLLVLVGVVAGFWIFNVRLFGQQHARVFMGDTGSMFLGLAIAWFLISLSQGEQRAMTPVTALWIFALPLVDTISVMLRRVFKRQSPFSADHGHFHHILSRAGFSVNKTVALMMGIQALMGGIGLMGLYAGVAEAVMFYVFFGISIVYLIVTTYMWSSPARTGMEQRINKRKDFVLNVKLYLANHEVKYLKSQDVSLGGVFINMAEIKVRLGSKVELAIQDPGNTGQEYRFTARTVRITDNGVAFAFEYCNADNFRALQKLVFEKTTNYRKDPEVTRHALTS